jgi:cytochrome P450
VPPSLPPPPPFSFLLPPPFSLLSLTLQYLEYVIHETLRLHPPALITTRDNSDPVTLGGYNFPARSLFFISIWALHHNERYWPDPEKFDPERYEGRLRKGEKGGRRREKVLEGRREILW